MSKKVLLTPPLIKLSSFQLCIFLLVSVKYRDLQNIRLQKISMYICYMITFFDGTLSKNETILPIKIVLSELGVSN